MHKCVDSIKLGFKVGNGTLNPGYAPFFEDCLEHVENGLQNNLFKKMMATGHCDEWESSNYDHLYITVEVDPDKDIDTVIKELLEVTLSDPDLEDVKDYVREERRKHIRDIIWDEDICNKRIALVDAQDIILFRSEEVEEEEDA